MDFCVLEQEVRHGGPTPLTIKCSMQVGPKGRPPLRGGDRLLAKGRSPLDREASPPDPGPGRAGPIWWLGLGLGGPDSSKWILKGFGLSFLHSNLVLIIGLVAGRLNRATTVRPLLRAYRIGCLHYVYIV